MINRRKFSHLNNEQADSLMNDHSIANEVLSSIFILCFIICFLGIFLWTVKQLLAAIGEFGNDLKKCGDQLFNMPREHKHALAGVALKYAAAKHRDKKKSDTATWLDKLGDEFIKSAEGTAETKADASDPGNWWKPDGWTPKTSDGDDDREPPSKPRFGTN
jgi:hypothetical protein